MRSEYVRSTCNGNDGQIMDQICHTSVDMKLFLSTFMSILCHIIKTGVLERYPHRYFLRFCLNAAKVDMIKY